MVNFLPRSWTLPKLSPLPAAAIEDSRLLRLGVLLMVCVGLVATDVAAEETWMSVWAIPATVVGFGWSYRARRDRNLVAKFLIALGMIVALVIFLSQLASFAQDSRLLLTKLLIQLQVLHSFDLPRRKDLGYSMVIGLILISVAATLSQTMTFGLFLFIFLAIALPVLVLDYRSRLGLLQVRLKGIGLSPRQWLATLALVLGLGMLTFLLLPRLPGYQIRTLPVSADIQVQEQFDQTRVVNPGYVGRGGRSGQGGDDLENIQFDSTFYYGFDSEINQTLGGELEPEVLMRVRSQAPGFWRMIAFDEYTGRGWRLSRNEDAEILQRSPWSYRFSIPSEIALGPTREVVQTYSILREFSNLIPHLNHPRDVFFPTQEIALDAAGGLRAPLTLPDGLTYSVISQVPLRDRSQLRQAPREYQPEIRRLYLAIPPEIAPAVRQQTEALLQRSDRPISEPYEQALYLAQALKQNYFIQPNLPPLDRDQDLVEAFLFQNEGGYPDQFSTVLTIMLRSIGIPARLVTGLGTGEFNPFTGLYVVKNTDAYALTEVFFPNYGWFTFDPIPGHDLYPASLEVDQTFTALQQFWNWIAQWLPTPVTGALGNLFALVDTAIQKFLGLFSQGIGGILRGVIILFGAGAIAWFSLQLLGQWRYRKRLGRLAKMERLYQEMLDWLAQQGYPKPLSQTPLEYGFNLGDRLEAPQQNIVLAITDAYVAWRYGQTTPEITTLEKQWQDLRRRGIKKTKATSTSR